MGTATVDDIATEFLRIIEEGYSPEIDEFLRHVPRDLREPARKRILEMTGKGKAIEPSTATDPAADKQPAREPVELVVRRMAPRKKPEPERSGPRRLTPEEAKQMFREMEARKKAGG